jgi:hypothetical protein
MVPFQQEKPAATAGAEVVILALTLPPAAGHSLAGAKPTVVPFAAWKLML